MLLRNAHSAFEKGLDLSSLSGPVTARRGLGSFILGGGTNRARRGTAQILKLYEESGWLRLAADTVGARYAAARWTILAPGGGRSRSRALRRKHRLLTAPPWERQALARAMHETGDMVELEDHPFLRMVNAGTMAAPWLAISGYELERMMFITRRLVGEDPRVLFRDETTRVPGMWFAVPPHWVEPPSRDRETFRIRIQSHTIDVDPEDMVWDRRPGLADPYDRGRGVGHSLDHELTIDEQAAQHLADYLRNRARPDLLIMAPGIGEPEKEALEEGWKAKLSGKSGLPFFLGVPGGLEASEVTVKDLQASLAETGSLELREREADAILMIMGVPPDIIGRTTSSNRATAFMAERFIRRNVAIPELEARQRFWQWRFFEPTGALEFAGEDRLVVHYQLPPLIDEEGRREVVQRVPHAFPQNHILAAAGYDPLEGGDTRYFVPAGITVRDLETEEPIARRQAMPDREDLRALMAGEPVESIARRRALTPWDAAALAAAAQELGF